jgi:hypothetical protein
MTLDLLPKMNLKPCFYDSCSLFMPWVQLKKSAHAFSRCTHILAELKAQVAKNQLTKSTEILIENDFQAYKVSFSV